MIAPPSRYSINQDDFDPVIGIRLVITLDGVVQDKVIAYDAEAGVVTRYQVNADGNHCIDPASGAAAVEDVAGTVTVTWKPIEAP